MRVCDNPMIPQTAWLAFSCIVCVYWSSKYHAGSKCKCSSPSGPRDVSVEWHINGRRLETRVSEHRRVVSHDAVLVSSWLREKAVSEDVQYECTAVSESGNDASKVQLRLNGRGIAASLALKCAILPSPVTWCMLCSLSDEAGVPHTHVDQWRNTLSEHNTLLQEWKKAWVRGKSVFLMLDVEF